MVAQLSGIHKWYVCRRIFQGASLASHWGARQVCIRLSGHLTSMCQTFMGPWNMAQDTASVICQAAWSHSNRGLYYPWSWTSQTSVGLHSRNVSLSWTQWPPCCWIQLTRRTSIWCPSLLRHVIQEYNYILLNRKHNVHGVALASTLNPFCLF
jgi:hypothetical protein